MTTPTATNSWMWATEEAVFGLRWDPDTSLLYWQEGIGCHCDDADVVQPVSAFVRDGVPGVMAPPPADVLAEIGASLEQAT